MPTPVGLFLSSTGISGLLSALLPGRWTHSWTTCLAPGDQHHIGPIPWAHSAAYPAAHCWALGPPSVGTDRAPGCPVSGNKQQTGTQGLTVVQTQALHFHPKSPWPCLTFLCSDFFIFERKVSIRSASLGYCENQKNQPKALGQDPDSP